jgi:hypothetical protein
MDTLGLMSSSVLGEAHPHLRPVSPTPIHLIPYLFSDAHAGGAEKEEEQ